MSNMALTYNINTMSNIALIYNINNVCSFHIFTAVINNKNFKISLVCIIISVIYICIYGELISRPSSTTYSVNWCNIQIMRLDLKPWANARLCQVFTMVWTNQNINVNVKYKHCYCLKRSCHDNFFKLGIKPEKCFGLEVDDFLATSKQCNSWNLTTESYFQPMTTYHL